MILDFEGELLFHCVVPHGRVVRVEARFACVHDELLDAAFAYLDDLVDLRGSFIFLFFYFFLQVSQGVFELLREALEWRVKCEVVDFEGGTSL